MYLLHRPVSEDDYMTKPKTSFDHAAEGFKRSASLINEMVASDINTVSLREFESRLLPVIREWVIERKADNILTWYIYAGSFSKRIKVIDNREFAFFVPPPFTDVILPEDRVSMAQVQKIDALNKLITMKERDGETKEALALSYQVNSMLDTKPDKLQQAKHVIMLAKMWEYLGLPVKEILADADITLSEYDSEGNYIATESTPIDKGLPNDIEEDEFEF